MSVTVIMRAYNQGQFLEESINSVLEQSYKNFELIVVNDGSTDNTFEILQKYKNRIKVIHQSNSGRSAAGNAALRQAKGEYITFLDSDDLWDVRFLEKTTHFLEFHKKYHLVYTGWMYIDSAGNKIGKEIRVKSKSDYYFELSLGAMFPINSALIRKECFDACGFFDKDIVFGEDWHLWLRFAKTGYRFACIDEILCKYRKHNLNTTKDFSILRQEVDFTIGKIYQAIGSHKYKRNLSMAKFYQEIYVARNYFEDGKINNAIQILNDALKIFDKNDRPSLYVIIKYISMLPLNEAFYAHAKQLVKCRIILVRWLMPMLFIYSVERQSNSRWFSLIKAITKFFKI